MTINKARLAGAAFALALAAGLVARIYSSAELDPSNVRLPPPGKEVLGPPRRD